MDRTRSHSLGWSPILLQDSPQQIGPIDVLRHVVAAAGASVPGGQMELEPSCLDSIELMSIGGGSIRKASSILAFVGTSTDQLDHPGAEHLGLGEAELQLALLIEETLAAPPKAIG